MNGRRHAYHRGRWALERERHRIEHERPTAPARDGVPIGSILDGLVRRLGLEVQANLDPLVSEWRQLVGDAVARHTRPGRLDGGRLLVYVDGSVWLSELHRCGRPAMLQNLQRRFGKDAIRSVSLKMDPDGARR